MPISSAQASLVDANFEWGQTYSYRVTGVTILPAAENGGQQASQSAGNKAAPAQAQIQTGPIEVEGQDSAPVTVTPKDVFPPAVPTDVEAVFSGPGQQPFIDLIWSPSPDTDLAGI